MRRRYRQQLQQFPLRFFQGMKICAHVFAKAFLDRFFITESSISTMGFVLTSPFSELDRGSPLLLPSLDRYNFHLKAVC